MSFNFYLEKGLFLIDTQATNNKEKVVIIPHNVKVNVTKKKYSKLLISLYHETPLSFFCIMEEIWQNFSFNIALLNDFGLFN